MANFIEIYHKIEKNIISNINIAHLVLMVKYVRELTRFRFNSEGGHDFFIHFFVFIFFNQIHFLQHK